MMAKARTSVVSELQYDFFGDLIEPAGHSYQMSQELEEHISEQRGGEEQGELFGDGLGLDSGNRGPTVSGPGTGELETEGDPEADTQTDEGGIGAPEDTVQSDVEEFDGLGDELGRGQGVERQTTGTAVVLDPGTPLEYRGYGHSVPSELGPRGRIEANLVALELLGRLETEGRRASADEQEFLARYSGWGGSSQVFQEGNPDGQRLARLLSEAEYKQARASTTTAFYTDTAVADFVWQAATKLGVSGKVRVLEPALGSGVFIARSPLEEAGFDAIEIDAVSARISAQLYQSSRVVHAGFEDIKLARSGYDLAISNVPFSEVSPYEAREVRTPGLDQRFPLHDFFFLKTLHGLREGGLVAYITSRFTMDKTGQSARERIAAQADVVAAFRFPDGAFKASAGTQVVADVILLQKRSREQEMSPTTRSWIETAPLVVDGHEFEINRYYHEHPENILGTTRVRSSMFGMAYNVEGTLAKLQGAFEGALSRLPGGIWKPLAQTAQQQQGEESSPAVQGLGLYELWADKEGQVYRAGLGGQIELVNLEPGSKEARRIVGLIGLRNSARGVFEALREGDESGFLKEQLNLSARYDLFVRDFGYVNERSNLKAFLNDPGQALVLALELWDREHQRATKAGIFTRGFEQVSPAPRPNSIEDAYLLSLAQTGGLDLSAMGGWLGIDEGDARAQLLAKELAFADPKDSQHLIAREEYLSGNVRVKLEQAIAARDREPQYAANVTALERVQPEKIPYMDIQISMNAPIMEPGEVKLFLEQELGASVHSLVRVRSTGAWDVSMYCDEKVWGTPGMYVEDLVHRIMNNQSMQVWRKLKEGKEELNHEATALAEQKAMKLKEAFASWIWRDPSRREQIQERYNRLFNATVTREFVHPMRLLQPDTAVELVGSSYPTALHPHQADAIWRGLQVKNAMYAHAVGAGKTREMIGTGMEQRRLGLRSKPWYVVPDNIIGQWASEFRAGYPQAKVLVADDENWSQINRKTFVTSAAYGEWDAVIIRQASFEMIPLSLDWQKAFMEKMIDLYAEELKELKKEAGLDRRTIKGMEKRVDNYRQTIRSLMDQPRDEGTLYFDDLGCDQLFIDEFDMYKNLAFTTRLENVRGLNSPEGSQRALDMFMKVRFVQEAGGGVIGATGTMLSNSLVEAWVMQRYLQPDYLKETGLEAFDTWCRQFAEAVVSMELNNTGTGYKPVTRMSKFINVPELVKVLREVVDIKTSQDLEEMGILVPGKNLPVKDVLNLTAPTTPLMKSFQKHLEHRESNISRATMNKDNILMIIGDGRKAAVDMRLINANFPDDLNSKLNRVVTGVFDRWREFEKDRWTQAVFFDFPCAYEKQGAGKDAKSVLVFDGVRTMIDKLVDLGIPKKQIYDMRNCTTDEKKLEIQKLVNAGDIRVIFGSTKNMGAGTNFQRRLGAIWHVDVPYRPRDIEQQNGRGYRQGNLCPRLLIVNTATKGSLDTGLWNLLETKDRTIRSLMQAKGSERVIEEDYYASVKELSIDDEVIKKSVTLAHQVKEMDRERAAWNTEQSNASYYLSEIPRTVARNREQIELIKKDIAKTDFNLGGDKFTIEVAGKSYTSRQQAGFEIIKQILLLKDHVKATGTSRDRVIGKFAGHDIAIGAHEWGDNLGELKIDTRSPQDCGTSISEESDPVGILTAFYGRIRELPAGIGWREELIKKELARAPLLEAQVSRGEYHRQAQLDKARQDYEETLKILRERPQAPSQDLFFPWLELKGMSRERVHAAVAQLNERAREASLRPQVATPAPATEVAVAEPAIATAVIPKPAGSFDEAWRRATGTSVPDRVLAKMEIRGVNWESHKDQLSELVADLARYRLVLEGQGLLRSGNDVLDRFHGLEKDKNHVLETFKYCTEDGSDPLAVSQKVMYSLTEGQVPEDERRIWIEAEDGMFHIGNASIERVGEVVSGFLAAKAAVKVISRVPVEVKKEFESGLEAGF